MCGIVGYVGPRRAVPVLLNGIKRVEYRGYDSAGMALLGDSGIQVVKQAGKVEQFEKRLKMEGVLDNPATVGIAHTRWATHGVPNDVNAHPQVSYPGKVAKVAVVHNGIITNFSELRDMLISRGHEFVSDTDTEVLPHLIGEYANGDPLEAVRSALTEVEGTYGIAVVFQDHPGVVVFAREGSPVLVGLDNERREYIVASDTASLVGQVDQQVIIEDGQLGYISQKEGCKVFDSKRVPVSSKVEEIDFELEDIKRDNYPHFMLKEICGQPDSLKNTISGRLDNGNVVLGGLADHDELLCSLEAHFFVAAGTSLHSGMIGEILFQEVSRVFAQWKNASELANQRLPLFPANSGIWAISQSGETADLILAMQRVAGLNLPIFGIPNVVGSSVARKSGKGVYINAGPEIGVASTKAFTSQVMVLNLLALYMRNLRKVPHEPWIDRYVRDLKRIPKQIAGIVERRETIRRIAVHYAHYRDFLYLGRGINLPVALEGALKLKEISYIHAEGYSTGEMKHGPLAMIDKNFPTVVIAPKRDDHYKKIISNIREITARGGPVIALAIEGDEEISKYVDHVIYVPDTTYYLTPLLFVIPLQLFAYYCAVELGHNVDQPRNLAKSVTVE